MRGVYLCRRGFTFAGVFFTSVRVVVTSEGVDFTFSGVVLPL